MTDPDQIGITTRQLLQELALAQAEYDAWHGVCQTAGIDPAMRVDYVDELVIRERLARASRSEEHTSELQSRPHLVCRLLLEKKKGASRWAATSMRASMYRTSERYTLEANSDYL